MMIRGVAVLVLLFAVNVVRAADFGSLSEVRAVHPEFFAPAHVSVVTNGGIAYYVYNGRARRLFKNMPATALPQLRDMAQLRAENNLSRFLLKGVPRRTLTLHGSRQIAKETDGDWATYVFAVPVSGVAITESPPGFSPTGTELQTNRVTGLQANNKTADYVAMVKPKGGDEDPLLALLDHLDRYPHDNSARIKLAKTMFAKQLYDESVEQCEMVQDALIPIMRSDTSEEDIESLLSASEILKECGEYRKARDGYRAVQRLERDEYRGIVLKALSQIQLKLGVE